VLPRHLFGASAFSVCVAAAVVMGFGTYGTLFVESIRLQTVGHLSALATGLMIVPFTLTPAITTRAIDRFGGGMHYGPRLVIGQLLAAAGAVCLAASVWMTGYGAVEVGLGLLGIAIGYVTPAMTTGVLAASPPETSGVASGILNAGRQVGATLGVALMGTLVQTLGDRGLLTSMAIVMLASLVVGLIAARSIEVA
jgi:MFS transporter, DHA2 family, methylenomycin A resistance protein